MRRWIVKLRPLAGGAITLGWLQAIQDIDFNQIWFEFLVTWLSALLSFLLGGDVNSVV
jgi:hypothetical protein